MYNKARRAQGIIGLSPISLRLYTTGSLQLPPVIRISKSDVYRFGDGNNSQPVFRNLEWTVNEGESWAIVGAAGQEKSELLETLLGHKRISPPPVKGVFPFLFNPENSLTQSRDPHGCISLVSFTAQRRASGGAFYDYTARYGAMREEDRVTLREALFSEIKNEEQLDELKLLAQRLDLEDLLDLPFIVLSNGQTRRARIAKALLGKPEVLLLDEPLTGLDVQHRPKLTNLLHELHKSRQPRVLMALRPQDPLPDWITHVALVRGQQINALPLGKATPLLSQLVTKERLRSTGSKEPVGEIPKHEIRKDLVVMKDLNVKYHDRHVLKNINWTIKEEDRWHLQGPNGSGKTTLISMLTGDHPQSYSQPAQPSHPFTALTLFSRPRRSQPTSSLQRLIGISSPEIAAAFPRRLGEGALSVRDAIATGFDGRYCYRKSSEVEDKRIDELLQHLGPARWSTDLRDGEREVATRNWESQLFASLPPGEQSMVLLMRALVGRAPLIVLDEPFAGMDSKMIAVAKKYLYPPYPHCAVSSDEEQQAFGLDKKQAVVFVTHWEEEVPWSGNSGEVFRSISIKNGMAIVS